MSESCSCFIAGVVIFILFFHLFLCCIDTLYVIISSFHNRLILCYVKLCFQWITQNILNIICRIRNII